MMLRLTERVRCVRRKESIPVYCKTWEEFKALVEKTYAGWHIVYTGIKARINPFSVHRIKLTWVKI
jgi:hypothetical protein